MSGANIRNFYVGSLVRHAETNAHIWKPWRCQNCNGRHAPNILICPEMKPPSDDRGYGNLQAMFIDIAGWLVIGLIVWWLT